MEREVQLMEGRQGWPLHMMGMAATGTTTNNCFDDYSSSSSSGGGGDCFVLGWEQLAAPAPFGCFGLLAADVHDLFPLFAAGMEPPALPAPPPSAHDVAAAIPGELDDLLLSFWDASCHDGDVGGEPLKAQQQQQQAAFNSSCVTHEQGYCTPTTDSFLHYDDGGDDPLSSIFSAGPAPALAAERALVFQQQAPAAEAEPLPSSSSSNSRGDPPGAGGVDLQLQLEGQGQGAAWARTPPLPRRTSTSAPSLKRATREESSSEQAAAAAAAAECSSQQSDGSNKRRKAAAAAGVVCPFALLKPDGLDGGATLADINARILMRPARPVRHPVGEFACAPRVSVDQPGISGKAVASFTRLHTPGRGTITIIRTRG